MRKILIVGAGQSGLHLGHDLLSRGYDVTVMTGESSTEIREGRPHIAQFPLPTALGRERELGLDFWKDQAPAITGTTMRLYPPTMAPLSLAGSFEGYATAVDRRVKMADWLEYFEDRGGKVVIQQARVCQTSGFGDALRQESRERTVQIGAELGHTQSRIVGSDRIELAEAVHKDVGLPLLRKLSIGDRTRRRQAGDQRRVPTPRISGREVLGHGTQTREAR